MQRKYPPAVRREPWFLLAALVAAGCREGTVRVAYRPAPGASSAYRLEVRTETELALEDRETSRRSSEARLRSTQTVVDVDASGARVRVRLERAGSAPRKFVARLDRAAHVRAIESVEGLPASVLGDVGLAELVPGAAGAVPDRPLRPGDRWEIDVPVGLPSAAASRLRGDGRLVELGVIDGHDVAVVRADTRLDVDRATSLREGRIRLSGVQATASTTRYDLEDGTVVEATSVTTGTFAVTLAPPADRDAVPVEGTLRVVVRSDVSRLRSSSSGAAPSSSLPPRRA